MNMRQTRIDTKNAAIREKMDSGIWILLRIAKRPQAMKGLCRGLWLLAVALAFLECGNKACATVGAVTPFVSVEAESGALGGGATIQALTAPPTSSDSSPTLEASGHAYVQLNATGQFVTLTNNTGQNITALNVRYSIADAPTGGGITNTLDLYVDGVFRQAISVNSKQTWCYQSSGSQHGWSKNPSSGKPHIFYDETHFFITGAAVAPGSTITFQQDSSNTASFYWLDVVDMENPPAPLSQPANSLSIVSYGAAANNPAVDSTAAIQNCINAAQSQRKLVWIPPGTYYLNTPAASLSATGITIQGAGMWYSTVYANPTLPDSSAGNILTPTSCTVQDLTFDSDATGAGNGTTNGNGNGGGLNVKGNNWVIDHVWIQHLGAGIWADGSNGIIENSRTSCTWADGINVNNGNGAAGNNTGNYLTISNCFVRGSGDDAFALNSGNSPGCLQMTNTTIINCTSVAPWWANNLGIYGGVNIIASNNLCMDSVGAYGISIGQFDDSGLPLESGMVVSNTVLRGGSYGFYNQNGVPALNVGTTHPIANVLVTGNTVSNAVFMGMGVDFCSSNVTVQYNTIISPSLNGLNVVSGATGSAIIYSNSVTGLNPGKSAFANFSSTFVVVTPEAASNYSSMSGITTETCAEGGQDITSIANGDWSAYNSINLTGVNTFVARVASAGVGVGGNIEIHLDSPAGTLVGTCPVTRTGGAQSYMNAYCNISGASGTHTIYLVYTGGAGNLFNVQYFGFFNTPPAASHQLVPGNTYSLKALVNGLYVTAPNNGSNSLIASSASVGKAESFKIIDAGGGNIGFQSLVNSNIVTAENGGNSPLIANRTGVGSWETFTEVDAGNGNIGLLAMVNGKYVTTPNSGASPLIASSTSVGTNESFTVGFVNGVPPATPTGLTAGTANSQVTLSWLASLGATSYTIGRSATSGGSYTTIATNLTGLSYTDTGLANATTYYYVVSAQNPAGTSTNSSQVSAMPGSLSRANWVASSSTSGGDSPANALDGDLTTRWSTGGSQVNGQWFQVDMGTSNVFNKLILNYVNSANDYPRGYQVTVSSDGINWSSSVATGVGSTSITTITFATQVARYVRVTQTGSTGNYWSIDEFNMMGTVPPAPTGLTATNTSSTQINLAWNAAVSASGYNLKRSTISGGSYATIATNLPYLNYSDSGLTSGTAYYYVVTATNIYGESVNAAEASARPVSTTSPQVNFAASAGQIQLNWPMDHTGWSMQMQTNSLGAGLGTNWVTVPTSKATNQMTFPIDPTSGSVFFRLIYP